jgi:alginate O-acetyltransferase complex protein AlgJ
MLRRYRRFFAIAAFLLLAAPLVVGVVRPDGPAAILREGRNLAPAPGMPTSGEGFLALPRQIDAYLQDHFGLRQALIRTHKDLTKPMLGLGNDSVLVGRDGRMFYLGEEAVRQSAGLILRDLGVAETVTLLKTIQDELAKRGVSFLVAAPPNASTVYQDDLPSWAQNAGKRTEYDLFLEGIAGKGIKSVDLRPVMMRARAEGPAYYRHETHWTPRGALAAYNAIVEADGRADWRLDPAFALAPPSERKGGDLARMLGVQDNVSEVAEDFALPEGPRELLSADPYGDYLRSSGKPGPTIVIIGDSFTAEKFTPMVAQHAGRVIWLDFKHCRFDWKPIDQYHPDEVWWMPNERFLICDPGARPVDFAETKRETALER